MKLVNLVITLGLAHMKIEPFITALFNLRRNALCQKLKNLLSFSLKYSHIIHLKISIASNQNQNLVGLQHGIYLNTSSI